MKFWFLCKTYWLISITLVMLTNVACCKKLMLKRSWLYNDIPEEKCESFDQNVCKPISECPNALRRIDVQSPKICWWKGEEPVICCPWIRCGIRPVISTSLVSRRKRQIRLSTVGGMVSIRNSWPWMAGILIQKNKKAQSQFLCGASLINERYVLTAAHCFNSTNKKADISNFSVVLGAHKIRGKDIDGKVFGVRSIKIYEGYREGQQYNDIALIRLSKEVSYGLHISPVCLPSPASNSNKPNLTGTQSVVTGWGDTSFGGISSKELQEVTVPIVSDSECALSYSNIEAVPFPNGIDGSMLCAGLPSGGKDACQVRHGSPSSIANRRASPEGDSGGPLMVSSKEKSEIRWTQVGIVSFGYGCGVPGYPGVYTRVDQFIKWIEINSRD